MSERKRNAIRMTIVKGVRTCSIGIVERSTCVR